LPFANVSRVNGPVPTGLAKNAFSLLPPKFFGRMLFVKAEMSETKGAHGALRWKTTVCVSSRRRRCSER